MSNGAYKWEFHHLCVHPPSDVYTNGYEQFTESWANTQAIMRDTSSFLTYIQVADEMDRKTDGPSPGIRDIPSIHCGCGGWLWTINLNRQGKRQPNWQIDPGVIGWEDMAIQQHAVMINPPTCIARVHLRRRITHLHGFYEEKLGL